MGLCCSSGSYPPALVIPLFENGGISAGIEVLDALDKQTVNQTIDVCARSFVGSPNAEPPREFEWLLHNFPDRTDSNGERKEQLSAVMAYSIHYAFILGSRGLVLIQRRDENDPLSEIVGCVIMYLYPRGWGGDGMCASLKAGTNAGAFNWSKLQNAFMESPRMKALEQCIESLHKTYASTAHIHVQIVAINPEFQGKSYGSKLLKAVSTIADEMRLACYLECDSGKNEAIYQKNGYITAGRLPLSVSSCESTQDESLLFSGQMCAMRREIGG